MLYLMRFKWQVMEEVINVDTIYSLHFSKVLLRARHYQPSDLLLSINEFLQFKLKIIESGSNPLWSQTMYQLFL